MKLGMLTTRWLSEWAGRLTANRTSDPERTVAAALTLSVALVICVGLSCSPARLPLHEHRDPELYAQSYDEVWMAVTEVLSAHAWTPDVLKKDSGLIIVDRIHFGPENSELDDYADCGDETIAPRTASLQVRVFEGDDGTEVTVTATFRGSKTVAPGDHECSTKGYLEGRVLREIEERLP